MKDPDHSFEADLQSFAPCPPDPASRDQLRAALRDARAEEALAAIVPVAPSELLRERIAQYCQAEQAAEQAAEHPADAAVVVGTARPIARPSSGRGFRIGAGILAAAAAIALAWFGITQLDQPGPAPGDVVEVPAPEPVNNDVVEVDGRDQIAKKTFPLPYAPVSAERVFVEAEDGGIEHIDGRPVQVVHLKLLDKLEYEQSGRRVIVERPVQQTIYNQLAYH